MQPRPRQWSGLRGKVKVQLTRLSAISLSPPCHHHSSCGHRQIEIWQSVESLRKQYRGRRRSRRSRRSRRRRWRKEEEEEEEEKEKDERHPTAI